MSTALLLITVVAIVAWLRFLEVAKPPFWVALAVTGVLCAAWIVVGLALWEERGR